MLNQYFNNFNYGREQDLVEDLTIECLKMYGYNVRYIPSTFVTVPVVVPGIDTVTPGIPSRVFESVTFPLTETF